MVRVPGRDLARDADRTVSALRRASQQMQQNPTDAAVGACRVNSNVQSERSRGMLNGQAR